MNNRRLLYYPVVIYVLLLLLVWYQHQPKKRIDADAQKHGKRQSCQMKKVQKSFDFWTLVRVARLERAASCSQSRRPTNWATPGNVKLSYNIFYYPPTE